MKQYDEEKLADEGIFVRLVPLPAGVDGMTLYDAAEGIYNVYLSNALMPLERTQAMRHELQHIRCRDFDKRHCGNIECTRN